jgi:serine/threonine protein phosphatase PrpC
MASRRDSNYQRLINRPLQASRMTPDRRASERDVAERTVLYSPRVVAPQRLATTQALHTRFTRFQNASARLRMQSELER